MTERVYPKLHDDRMNFMMDKQKALREKLTHYKKIKNKWSCANAALKPDKGGNRLYLNPYKR